MKQVTPASTKRRSRSIAWAREREPGCAPASSFPGTTQYDASMGRARLHPPSGTAPACLVVVMPDMISHRPHSPVRRGGRL